MLFNGDKSEGYNRAITHQCDSIFLFGNLICVILIPCHSFLLYTIKTCLCIAMLEKLSYIYENNNEQYTHTII